MPVASWDITPGNAASLRDATAMGVLNTKYRIAYIPQLVLVRVMGDSNPSSTTRIRVGRWPT